MRKDIRLAGFGGQGVILAGYILGKAAALYDHKEAVFTRSYGPEARGGACAAAIIISDEPVDYPLVTSPDYLVLLSHEAFAQYGPQLNDRGFVIMDSDMVETTTRGKHIYRVPFTRIAEGLGNRIVVNIVMLGFLTAVTGVVSRESMEEAIRTSVRERTIPLNLKAFAAGYDYCQERAA